MRVGKHTIFMIKFITDFINGEIERYFFVFGLFCICNRAFSPYGV
ncbi:hypothetical protein Clocl_2694 [Acetivibrio clariflavus DSM 19732]|uniref:Uncharacterized protein n=1 Tax=Acetivibrio clariflavus (strain DSM 19732 / NBRC 101661 / EBR45) TaxID=720554 RepID=G8M294_ACECE|nr:hypothetical protein Clocl_2694 [Acetivibrio clariflavus DSM 19732]